MEVAFNPWLTLSCGLSGVTKIENNVSEPPGGRYATMLPSPLPAGPGGEFSDPCHWSGGTSALLMIGPFWT